MKTKPKAFGRDWTDGAVNFPKHLTPEVIHSALFIHNADSKEDTLIRVEHCAKLIGDELMSYAMSLLVLPMLMDNMKQSNEYKEWQEQTKPNRLN
jgi:hypothetical protein